LLMMARPVGGVRATSDERWWLAQRLRVVLLACDDR